MADDYGEIFNEISEFLQKGKAKDIVVSVQKALDAGAAPADILENALMTGMNIIGGKFKSGEIFVPEVLISARAMNKAAEILKPHLAKAGVNPVGRAIICTVKGDQHDIGKNLVKMMIEGKGIEVDDLGVDCDTQLVVNKVKETDAKVLCLSALLTTTMTVQKDVIDALKKAGVRDKVKVMVGGAPVTQSFADEIGADAYTPDAASAAEVCRSFYS
jgi:5-methyltetrahydrofolate--homocysteine methyltransferase